MLLSVTCNIVLLSLWDKEKPFIYSFSHYNRKIFPFTRSFKPRSRKLAWLVELAAVEIFGLTKRERMASYQSQNTLSQDFIVTHTNKMCLFKVKPYLEETWLSTYHACFTSKTWKSTRYKSFSHNKYRGEKKNVNSS